MRLFRKDDPKPSLVAGPIAEFFGVLVVVFASAGVVAVQPLLPVASPATVALVQGFVLMGAIWAAGTWSGGHVNPLVTIMLFVHGMLEKGLENAAGVKVKGGGRMVNFEWYYALLWILAQFGGAVAAGALLLAVFGPDSPLGRPEVGIAGLAFGRAFAFEIVGSFVLFMTILLAIGYGADHALWAAVPIGAASITRESTCSGGRTGVSGHGGGAEPMLNLLRLVRPRVDANDGVLGRNVDWIWYVGPLLGLVAALLVFWIYYNWFWPKETAEMMTVEDDDDDVDVEEAAYPMGSRTSMYASPRGPRQARVQSGPVLLTPPRLLAIPPPPRPY